VTFFAKGNMMDIILFVLVAYIAFRAVGALLKSLYK